MNSESSFKFRLKKYPVPDRFNQLLTPPKLVQNNVPGKNSCKTSPKAPFIGDFLHIPRAPATKPTWRHEVGVFLSRTVFPWPWKRCMFPHEFGLEFGGIFCWNFGRNTAILYLSITESSCETVKPLLVRKKTRSWLERRLEFLIPTVTRENIQHGTPKISPSITPFFQIEISIGWFTLFSKSHLSPQPQKKNSHRDPFHPLFLPPFHHHKTHRTSKHIIQSNGGAPEMALLPSAGTKEMVWPTKPPPWLGWPPKQLGFSSVILCFFQIRPFSGNDEGRNKKGSLNLGIFIINP